MNDTTAEIFRSLVAMQMATGESASEAVASIRDRLMASTSSLRSELPRTLHLRVPDPEVVKAHTRSSFAFVFADSKFSTLRPSIFAGRHTESAYEVFGNSDLVIRAQGTGADFDGLIASLHDDHVEVTTVLVGKVLRYYGHKVPETMTSLTEREYQDLALWVAGSSEEPLPPDEVRDRPRGALGIVYLDDPHAPARLRALIGIEAAGFDKDKFRSHFPSMLNALTTREVNLSLLSLFQCAEGVYEFLIDAYFSHVVTLNKFVDEIVEVSGRDFAALRVHTATYVVAKVVAERIPAPATASPATAPESPDGYLRLLSEVRPLLPNSDVVHTAFGQMKEYRRAYLISWLSQLGQLGTQAEEVMETYNNVRVEFVEGYVTENRTRLLSAINALSLALNLVACDVVQQITTLYFDGNFADARAAVGVDTLRPRPVDLTVGECKTFFEAWRAKSTWSEFVRIPAELSRWMDALAPARNAAAHRETRSDIWELGVEVGPALLNGLRALIVARALARMLRESAEPDKGSRVEDVLQIRLVTVGAAVAREIRYLKDTTVRLQHELRTRPDEWKTWLAANREQLESVISRLESDASASPNASKADIGRVTSAAAGARRALAGGADIAQLVSFLSGVSSLPWLIQHASAGDAISLLTNLARRLAGP